MHKYRSLAAWKHGHDLLIATFKLTDKHFHAKAKPLFDQLRRAVVSVEANVVEGYALSTSALFRRHLRIALGSAAEAECLLNAAIELEYIPDDAGGELLKRADSTLRSLFGLLRSPNLLTRN